MRENIFLKNHDFAVIILNCELDIQKKNNFSQTSQTVGEINKRNLKFYCYTILQTV